MQRIIRFLPVAFISVCSLLSMGMLGSIGIMEVIVIALLILAIATIISLINGRVWWARILFKIAEWRIYDKSAGTYKKLTVPEGKLSRSPFIPSVMITFVLYNIMLLVSSGLHYWGNKEGADLATRAFVIVSIVFYYGSWITAFILHFRPNSSRKEKYNWIFLGFLLIACVMSLQDDTLFVIVELMILLPLFLTWLPAAWLNRHISGSLIHPTPAARFVLRAVRLISFPIVILAMYRQPYLVLMPFLILRYYIIEFYRLRPIIYLRSFHYRNAKTVYGKLIAPAALKFGVIAGIVNRSQKGSELLSAAGIVNFAHTYIIPDESWKDWVLHELSRAGAVIIDNTVSTESVRWEMTNALEQVGREKIIVLQKSGSGGDVPQDLRVIEYTPDRKGLKAGKLKLNRALNDIFRV